MSRKSSSKIPVSTSATTPSSGNVPRSGTKKVEASKFELIAELGRGGMATVYLARAKARPEKLIVLKQLRSDLADNPEFLAMFLEEARLAGKLQHPNIVETYEVGEDAGTYYIAMEYLDGLSLQAILTKFGWKGDFTFAMQVYVLIEVLKGLEHAYNQRDDDGQPLRIVHRDVSPPNIIVTFDGQVKLVDFGIAKAANSNVETRTGLIKGKLTYMAPEQAQSGDVDNRTDIYSVGVMLWQAAAGRRRWKGVENTEVLKRLHAGQVADSPNATGNGLPARVDSIVLKAIAADSEGRYSSHGALRAELEGLLVDFKAEVGGRDLSVFMACQFGEPRERAGQLIRDRLRELSGPPLQQPNEIGTAIRRSGPSEDESKPASASPRVINRGGDIVVRTTPPTPPKKTRRFDNATNNYVGENALRANRSVRRRNYVAPIATLGFAAAAVLFVLAFKSRRALVEAKVASPRSPLTSTTAVPSYPASAVSTPPEVTIGNTASPQSSVADASFAARPSEPRVTDRKSHAKVSPNQKSSAQRLPAPTTMTNPPGALPPASASAAVDPWGAPQSSNHGVNRVDPWAAPAKGDSR